jgi:hypothetical protein
VFDTENYNKTPPSLDEFINNEKVEVKRKKEIPPKEAKAKRMSCYENRQG